MPLKELQQLQKVNRFLKLELSKENELQEITALAAKICSAPVALVTTYSEGDSHLRFVAGEENISKKTLNQLYEFVHHEDELLIINDVFTHPNFKENPVFIGKRKVRFYVGLHLTTKDGYYLGNLCVVDYLPKELSETQIAILKILAKQIMQTFEFVDSVEILKNHFIKAKDSLNKLRSFFDASHSSYLFIGKQMEIVAYNNAFQVAITALFRKEVIIGSSVLDYITEHDKASFETHYRAALGGKSVKMDKEIRGPFLSSWWHLTYDPAKDEDGNIIGVSFNASDISGRIEQEEKLDNQTLTLKEIAWMQSHELRKPVASILGLMELIKEDGYVAPKEILLKMEEATLELDDKIKMIVSHA